MKPSFSRMAVRRDIRSRMPQASYYRNRGQSPALIRTRRRYLLPNAITGICIFSLAIGIYAFTLHAVGQDEFEDVPIPDGPAPSAGAPHASMNSSGGSTSVGR